MLHPGLRLLGQPVEAHFGPLRQFTIVNANHPQRHRADPGPARPSASAQRQAPHRDVLAAERRERARIRGEKGIRRVGGR